MNNSNKQSKAAVLRQKAEYLLKKKSLKTSSPLSEIETRRLIHELEVHQIELELQNEELMMASSSAQEAVKKYSKLYDFAPSGFFTLSNEGIIIELNLSVAKMLGKEHSRLIYSQFGLFVSNETKPIFNLFLEKVLSSKAKESCEVILSVNDNLPMYVQLTGIATENGEQCLVTVIEITERKRAEESLRASEARFKTIFNEAPLGIALSDSLTGQVYSVNPMFAKIAGRTMEEMKHIDWMSITHPDDIQEDLDNMALLNAGKISRFQMEKRYLHHDGTCVWINMSITPINIEDKAHPCHLCMIEDITERKKAEINLKEKNEYIEAQNKKYIQINNELAFQNKEKEKRASELIIAKEKVEESDRLKTAFLYNISHEIRTPFNGILGFLSILQDYELPDSERDEYIGIINQSADRLMNTINEIVEISQIQAGQMQVTASEINIKMLTGELVDQFKSFTESKKLKFNINNELPNKITCISTDGIKLKAILSNLVGNAFKFTKAGSIELEIRQKGDYLEFSIKDSGIGFPENKIKIIFERFMQTDVSKTREYEGLGLGLSIAKAYVKMLGGKIWAKSEEGKGSTFFFTIKCNIKPE